MLDEDESHSDLRLRYEIESLASKHQCSGSSCEPQDSLRSMHQEDLRNGSKVEAHEIPGCQCIADRA